MSPRADEEFSLIVIVGSYPPIHPPQHAPARDGREIVGRFWNVTNGNLHVPPSDTNRKAPGGSSVERRF